MKCRNCGENDANFIYTKIVNGEKQELVLCSDCAKKLGIEDWNLDFNMPIDFSSFLGDFWNEEDNIFLNPFENKAENKCLNCGMTFEEFLNKGKFGCSSCYSAFENKLDEVMKQIHGAKRHIGRKAKILDKLKEGKEKIEEKHQEIKEKIEEKNNEKHKLNNLKRELKTAISEERYEDAAKLRDEIKSLEDNK